MSIVAISDTLGSFGHEIGERVAAAAGYEFADREIIARAAERFGEGVLELTHVTEEKPTLWERFTDTQRRYVAYVNAVILEMAARDDVVLAGRGATVLLRAVPHALRVRISAPEPVRAERVRQQQGLTDEAALGAVHDSDRERGARLRFLHHVDWNDPLLYDLVLNTERLGAERGARLIHQMLGEDRFQTTAAARRTILDLSLAAQVTAALLADPRLRSRHLGASCADGHVQLTGYVREEDARALAQQVVEKIAGVRGVVNEIVVIYPRPVGV